MSDYGELVLELDKLIRCEKSKLSQSFKCDTRRPTRENSSGGAGVSPFRCHTSMSDVIDIKTSFPEGSDSYQDRTAGVLDSNGASPVADMRQARLFRTRFCQFGTDCPYFIKGTCLYAHNKDEMRLRPPPPKGYKAPGGSPMSGGVRHSLPGVSPTLPDRSRSGSAESLWSLPDSAEGFKQPTVRSASLLDCLPSNLSGSRVLNV